MPSRFIGHSEQREQLARRFQSKKLGQTLLFQGPTSIGKKLLALDLAQKDLCEKNNSCGSCQPCCLYLETNLIDAPPPNLLFIAPEGKAGQIKVESLRSVQDLEGGIFEWLGTSLGPDLHKWVIIDDAHQLNTTSANMLLKLLEEPPSHVYFILITHRPEAMLPTIKSRCERVIISPLDSSEVQQIALSHGWVKGEIPPMLSLAEGTCRYLDLERYERALLQVDTWLKLLEGKGDLRDIDQLLTQKKEDEATASNQWLRDTLELLLRIINDLNRIRYQAEPSLLFYSERLRIISEREIPLREIEDKALEALRHVDRNPSANMILQELAFLLT